MDEFSCINGTSDDFHRIKEALREAGAAAFQYHLGNGTAFVICLTSNFETIGLILNGGSPRGRVWMSIQGIGACHFAPKWTAASYFESKLQIPEDDAKAIERLWTGLWGES